MREGLSPNGDCPSNWDRPKNAFWDSPCLP
jgi:hypothetical protein